MNYLMVGLRVTHILAGVFWAGATLITTYHLKQSTDLTSRRRLATAMTAAGILNVLAGYAMYWLDSDGFSSAWTHSGPGIGFAIGGAFGLFGLVIRVFANRKIKSLSRPDNQLSENLVGDEQQLARLDILNVWALLIAVLFMAAARYLVF